MALDANSLNGYLVVYAEKSLEQMIASMPKVDLFTQNFSDAIENGGTAITTRISTTQWGANNDLSLGWSPNTASTQTITATLKLRDQDLIFNELQYATVTPNAIFNSFFKPMVKQLVAGIVVDCFNLVTSSYFSSSLSVPSSSQFTVTGSYSLQTCSNILDNNEIPFDGRYAITTPNAYSYLLNGVVPTYYYGDDSAVKYNKVQELLGFKLERNPRLYGATLPQGGSAAGGSTNKLIGIAGHADGIVLAVRQPLDPSNGQLMAATATDPSSNLSVQTRVYWDGSKPAYRLAAVALYGVAAGNPYAAIPIVTQSV